MARIAGVDIPRDKRVEVSLSYIFGIGRPTAHKICAAANVPLETKVRDLTDDEVARIREYIDKNHTVEGELRKEVRQDIQRLIEISSYRGIRHRRGLPARGQRTRTNARTSPPPSTTLRLHSRTQTARFYRGRPQAPPGSKVLARAPPTLPVSPQRRRRAGQWNTASGRWKCASKDPAAGARRPSALSSLRGFRSRTFGTSRQCPTTAAARPSAVACRRERTEERRVGKECRSRW